MEQKPSFDNFEIDFLALGKLLWTERKKFVLRALACGALAVAVSFAVPKVFQSQALLIPVAGSDQDKLSSLAGQLGGIATLAGLPIAGGSKVDKTQLALETLKSRDFLARFAQAHGVDTVLFPGEKPSSTQVQERLLRKHIEIAEDKKTGLIRLSMNARTPEVAKAWLEGLIREINDYGRNREITEKEQNIDYLLEQVHKTDVAELRQAFFTLIQRQTSDLMIAQTQKEFIFKTVDPPVAPIRKHSPKRVQFLIAGLILALGWGLYEFAFRRGLDLWVKPTGTRK